MLCYMHYVSRNSGNTYSNNLGIMRHNFAYFLHCAEYRVKYTHHSITCDAHNARA